MSYTLIEVLKFLGIRWSIENNRLDRKSERFRRATEKLEQQSWTQTDPELTQQLQAESEKLYREWDEAEQAFYIPWDHCFSNAVEWCAAHTAIGSDFIRKLAIVGFDASHLMPEQEDLLSALPKLVEKLLGLPREDWKDTGWMRFVLSLQSQSEANSQANDGASATRPLKLEAEESPRQGLIDVYRAAEYARMKNPNQKLKPRQIWEFWTDPKRGLAEVDHDEWPDLVGYDPGKYSTFQSELCRAGKHSMILEYAFGPVAQDEMSRSIVRLRRDERAVKSTERIV